VPDLYQGTELWDFSLVDPDNRRPVDFEQRMRLLDDLEAGLTPEQVLSRAAEGLPKLWVIRQALDLRRRRPELFEADAFYQPIPVQEATALAFARGGSRDGEAQASAVVVVPRFPLRWLAEPPDATLHLPPGPWRSLLSGENLPGGEVNLESLLKRFQVCLLEREAEDE
jgi:(1->4)-alpha-D-glucan 1-alpha-D-glucosylmutase